MKKIVVYGAGPYGKIFYYDVKKYKAIDIVAFTVDRKYMSEEEIDGIPVVPFEDVEKIYNPSEYDMIVICGYTRMRNRKLMYEKAKSKSYSLINYVSPGAYIEAGIEMGDNNVILSGSEIGYDVKLGNGNFINQFCYIAHNIRMGDHNIISARCTIGGFSTFDDLSFLGYSVSCQGYTTFGNECLVGMGSVVTSNVPDFAKVYGVPTRVISYHEETGVVIDEYKKYREYIGQ